MTNINKEAISILNRLIEVSKDGQKGFQSCADDVKNPQLKALFVQRAGDCSTSAVELQAEVRKLGGDPETSTSVVGDLHRRWVDVKALFTGKGEEAVLNEAERGEDHAKKAYSEALVKLAKYSNLVELTDLVNRQYQGVLRNHDQIKALRNIARAS
ncbi:PA2169 family four-helix-bundle protein [Pseudomonas sp. FEN]|uniref:PA2169 family four-helix-bundle protein n=1 Tax=Pseudomonas sp. FEN TaxID=2767468 RepID=UPI00174CADCC|nr:PA2169 family four-helix-bundle protein [Pseudomonas sp. FEN]CAD5200641.1 hypothetical protein [Pseudomonas sp. FEN]